TVALVPSLVVVEVSPETLSLNILEKGTFKAIVTGSPDTQVRWSLNPDLGNVSEEGIYTAPSSIPTGQTLTVTATSLAVPTRSGSAQIILKPLSLKLIPSNATLGPSEMVRFSTAVDGTADKSIVWSVSGPGTISNGTYVAPASMATARTVIVKATSHADSAISATASVTLRPVVSVGINPSMATLTSGQQQAFSAPVSGSADTSVTLSLSGPGSISNGVYVAPTPISSSQPVTVTARSVADNTKTATARINLVPVSINVSPNRTT